MPHILTTIIFLPLAGALVIAFIPARCEKLIRFTAAAFNALLLTIAGILCFQFNKAADGMQFLESQPWIPQANIHYTLGVDGISLGLVFLTTLLGFLACLASHTIRTRIKEYFLIYQCFRILHFCPLVGD